jgi:hypothetical protein
MEKFKPKEWLEKNGKKPLEDALTQMRLELAKTERAMLLIHFATELALSPGDIVNASLQFAKY